LVGLGSRTGGTKADALPVRSCLIDGEAIVSDESGLAVFELIRSFRHGHAAVQCVIHPNSIAVSREHRRAKTDRLDTELLLRGMDPAPRSSPPMRMIASWCDAQRIDRIQGCGAISA
jgi:hypothetical protein